MTKPFPQSLVPADTRIHEGIPRSVGGFDAPTSTGVSKRLQPPTTRRPTIRDIAHEAGVSIATISRVLNEQPGVAPETRTAVLRVIRQRGFSSNPTARRLSGGDTGLVSVMLPRIQSWYFATLTASVVAALDEYGLRAVICPSGHEHDREVSLLNRLTQGATDGAVLILPSESSEELSALAAQGFPCVVLDPKMPIDDGLPCVSVTNAPGARDATLHLLSLGHRRIAAVTGPHGWAATDERLDGYHGALAGAGVMPNRALEIESDFNLAGGYNAGQLLLDLAEPPTAVFAFNDDLAIGVMRAARSRGLRVPEDISVVGFDDSAEASLVSPALSSVRQPLKQMGWMAVALLARIMHGPTAEALTVELATRLVVRDSTTDRTGLGPSPTVAT